MGKVEESERGMRKGRERGKEVGTEGGKRKRRRGGNHRRGSYISTNEEERDKAGKWKEKIK